MIGGSLAWAVKRRGLADEVVGVDRDAASLEYAVKAGLLDRTATLAEGVREAEVVVVAVPPGAVVSLLADLAGVIDAATIVTDVAGVKRPIVEAGCALPRFVGAHPMAGSERSGPSAASADLFEGATCAVTPTQQTDPTAIEAVASLWRGVGASVVRMDPATHDEVVAAVSHLPHLLAYALVGTAAEVRPDGEAFALAASGFRDMTRIAASAPDLWRDLCLMNREPLLAMIDRYTTTVGRLRALIDRADGEGLRRQFEQARALRASLSEVRG